ncbi:hypothetical protein [Herbiconiux sp. L3-i23]|uniref:hypothetical protein n=1 Tax=Herbiconiux sp. L3-i23 TaxID=2905871 RepID=UPI002069F8B6|nr:hypothetical protein [Herbiconiux sp. L3-i23]BDI22986.1 hypothetical protein L3i23_17620 [Herbiconiux sp. L3-i23]
MTAKLTVSSVERAEARLRLGAATLPESFRYVDGDADVVGLVGDGDWVARAVEAVERGARGVLVVDPEIADVARLRAALATHNAVVVLDHGWASSPSVERAADDFARLAEPTALIESRIDAPVGADVARVLSRHVALIRAAVAPIASLRLLRADAAGYDVLGEVEGGADLVLSGVFTDALPESARVRIVRHHATVVLEMGAIDVAAPGRVRILDATSDVAPLTPFETPHRCAWRRLHAVVVGGAVVNELDGFDEDSALVRAALESASVSA